MSIQVGQTKTVRRTFAQADFDRFAVLSGDDNPIHVDPAFAARTSFGATVAHGMLLYGTVCGALGTWLPGMVQLEQELMFPSPTYAGEEVTIHLEITSVKPVAGLAALTTIVSRPDQNIDLQDRTLVQLPDRTSRNQTPSLARFEASAPTPTNTLKDLQVGKRAETRRAFALQELAEYADLTGDANPIYTDATYARDAGFDGPLVPGCLLGGLFSHLLGTRLPGRGTNYLKQRLVFPAPAHPGETLAAVVEVTRLRPRKELVNLRTICTKQTGVTVCNGEALVLVRDLEGG